MKLLIEIIKGRRVDGEKLPKPTERIVFPDKKLSYSEWCRRFNVSAMSNHKPV